MTDALDMARPLLVLVSAPAEAAEPLARPLIEARLAACVSIVPGLRSIYRWGADIEQAEEVLLLIKTTAACYPALQAAVLAAHPYELPEVLAVDVAAGLPAYLRWLADSASPPD